MHMLSFTITKAGVAREGKTVYTGRLPLHVYHQLRDSGPTLLMND